MSELKKETRDFITRKQERHATATQMAALRLCCGMDLAVELAGDVSARTTALRRLARMVERERLKGQRRHWAYDLNRHIALKQAADVLRRSISNSGHDERTARRTVAPGQL